MPLTLKVRVNTAGVQREVGVVVESLRDLQPVLKRFGGYLRNKAKESFSEEGPGWAPLAASTRDRLEHLRTNRITAQGTLRKSAERQLVAGLRRAAQKGKIPESTVGAVLRLAHEYAQDKEKLARARRFGVANHPLAAEVRSRAFQRLAAALEKATTKTAAQRASGQKQIAKHKLLGKLSTSLRVVVEGRRIVVRSTVPWAGVHNEGGTVAHGAHVPERQFLADPTDEDMMVFDIILGSHLEEKRGGAK